MLVPNKVKWPHEYVLSSSHKERVSYDQLSIIQWVTGFCRIMRDEQDKTIQNSMLDYLIALFDDANDFSWDAAKASHAVLLCRMEQGEIKNYAQVEKIDRVRRANAQRHISSVSSTSQMTGSKMYTSKSTKSMPCQYYNQGSCVHQKSHDTRGTLYKHICTHCFATSGKTLSLGVTDCRLYRFSLLFTHKSCSLDVFPVSRSGGLVQVVPLFSFKTGGRVQGLLLLVRSSFTLYLCFSSEGLTFLTCYLRLLSFLVRGPLAQRSKVDKVLH